MTQLREDARPSTSGAPTTSSRKAEHLRINLEEDVAAKGVASGWADYRFVHCALPEVDLADVSTGVEVLGWRLRAPLLISCMTGGTEQARRINANLAEAAEACGIALGLGSARVLLEGPEHVRSFDVRGLAPSVPLLANLGAVQLRRGVGADDCRRLVELLGADALVLHLNPLQEALQAGGDTCFGGLLRSIAALATALEVPVIVKEVGWGIAPDLVRALVDAGVAAVDVAGAGGTSWSEVERHRLGGTAARVAAEFAAWGIPSAQALEQARAAAPEAPLIASGGVTCGLDVAVALGLGADLVGAAGPFLRAAAAGPEAATELASSWIGVLRVAMFCTGSRRVADLRSGSRLVRRDRGAAESARSDAAAMLATLLESIAELRGTRISPPRGTRS
ncbi:MAG: type 2 isopentenyl-diphosphate Delta-isomerase [Candidatus Dormibacteria bacterium]